jgi:hypothetical protein
MSDRVAGVFPGRSYDSHLDDGCDAGLTGSHNDDDCASCHPELESLRTRKGHRAALILCEGNGCGCDCHR